MVLCPPIITERVIRETSTVTTTHITHMDLSHIVPIANLGARLAEDRIGQSHMLFRIILGANISSPGRKAQNAIQGQSQKESVG